MVEKIQTGIEFRLGICECAPWYQGAVQEKQLTLDRFGDQAIHPILLTLKEVYISEERHKALLTSRCHAFLDTHQDARRRLPQDYLAELTLYEIPSTRTWPAEEYIRRINLGWGDYSETDWITLEQPPTVDDVLEQLKGLIQRIRSRRKFRTWMNQMSPVK